MTAAIEMVDVIDEPQVIEGRSPFALALRRLRKIGRASCRERV